MLRELRDVRQIPGESRRRWFVSDYFNLVVWYDDDDARVSGFHLHYDRGRDERVFVWDAEGHRGALRHCEVDDGLQAGGMKMTPVFTRARAADPRAVAERFERESPEIERPLVELVLEKLGGGVER